MRQTDNYLIDVGKVSHIDKPETLTNRAAIHEDIEIKCFYEGTATLLIESRAVSVEAGDIVVINPYEFHATVDTGENTSKYHLFMLSLDYFSGIPELDLRKLFFAEEKKFQNLFRKNTQMYALLMQAAKEAAQEEVTGDLMIKSLLMCFFTLLLRQGTIDTEGIAPDRLYSVIEPALRCIKNEYHRTLTVQYLADLCNVSKHYFCRAFKTVTKRSPMGYLRHFRLQVANTLLSCTDSSISEIAASCGFESLNYFSRCYKQYYGKSPSRNRSPKES